MNGTDAVERELIHDQRYELHITGNVVQAGDWLIWVINLHTSNLTHAPLPHTPCLFLLRYARTIRSTIQAKSVSLHSKT